jgi:HK97 family phage major capsid protein
MATLQDMLNEQEKIKLELQRMESDESSTEEADGNYRDSLVFRWEELDELTKPLIARMAKISSITRAAANPENRESGDGGGGAVSRMDGRSPEFMRRVDPYAEMDKVANHLVPRKDMVARSLSAIELDNKHGLMEGDTAEEATRKSQRDPTIARHVLLTGQPEYVENFREYVRNPNNEAARTALALTTGTNGAGFLLPYVLDPTIVLTNAGSANPYRRISNVITTTSNAWFGVNSAGVNAGWLDEAVTATDSNPTMGQIAIYAKKAAAWVYGSFEVLDDTNFGDQLPGLLTDAKDRLEEAAFSIGSGATGVNTGQPRGVLYAISQTGTGSRVLSAAGTGAGLPTSTSGAFAGSTGAVDVYNMQAALPARFRASSKVAWVANILNINRIRALDQYGGSSFWANLGADTPERLLNKPIYESTSITQTANMATGTAGTASSANCPLLFGDFNQFNIVDRVGTSILYEKVVHGTAAANPVVPTGQSGWFMFWRVGSDVTTPAAFRWLTNGSG